MAKFIVRHSKYPRNPKAFVVSIDHVMKLTGEPGTIFALPRSDTNFWELHVAPPDDAIDALGNKVPSLWMGVDIEGTVDATIVKAVNQISQQVDWSQNGLFEEEDDYGPPQVTATIPEDGQENVDLRQMIKITLEDRLPAVGIDLDSIVLTVDGVEVVPTQVKGHPFKVDIYYDPPHVIEEER